MAEKKTMSRARKDKREGKSPTTQAGEFVREELHHIREGKHGARSAKQAIAIGLSKARRAGVKLPPPAKGEASEKTRKSAERAFRRGQGQEPKGRPSPTRSKATRGALKQVGTSAASHESAESAREIGRKRPQEAAPKRAFGRREESGPNQKWGGTLCRGAQSRLHPSGSRLKPRQR